MSEGVFVVMCLAELGLIISTFVLLVCNKET